MFSASWGLFLFWLMAPICHVKPFSPKRLQFQDVCLFTGAGHLFVCCLNYHHLQMVAINRNIFPTLL